MTMIRKILIANRGEIARRIQRSCRKMGIGVVAVYSEADAGAPFVKEAEEAVCIGGAAAVDSYLNIDKLIRAARQTKADAIHPGYGFLAERAEFAIRVREAGLIWIGPHPEAIEAMGSKSRAKAIMEEAGVPVIPGYSGKDQSVDRLRSEALKIGFPVLLKAVAGGGGKGMRIVEREADLENAIQSARREADSAFGDANLLIEKFFPNARHVEFQIFGDQHGKVIHLMERECSIQRRYQKILEESPSPVLSATLRNTMGAAAVEAARAIGYDNAGTIEFIYTDGGVFYFLEVNTRLQVEHPVTEAITGLDLVQWQIEIAEGKPLPLEQQEVKANGYALECRLYAEDPEENYLPATGEILQWKVPDMEGLRVDSGVETGSIISIHYDPMIAKLIVQASERETAFRRMTYVLRHLQCLGIVTNQAFLLSLLQREEVLLGQYSTRFLEKEKFTPSKPGFDSIGISLVALTLFRMEKSLRNRQVLKGLPPGWRNNPYQPQEVSYQIGEEVYSPMYTFRKDQMEGRLGKVPFKAKMLWKTADSIRVQFNERQSTIQLVGREADWYLHSPTYGSYKVSLLPRFPKVDKEKMPGGYLAPMPGSVVEVWVEPGALVEEGAKLVTLSSMKMENTLVADEAGKVKAVFVTTGDQVEAETVLLQIQSEEPNENPKA